MFIEAQASASLGQDGGERRLPHLQRLTAQVVAFQFDQVKHIEEHGLVVAAMAQPIEVRHPVVVAGHCFAIEDHRARTQAAQRFNNQGEAIGQVIAGAAV